MLNYKMLKNICAHVQKFFLCEVSPMKAVSNRVDWIHVCRVDENHMTFSGSFKHWNLSFPSGWSSFERYGRKIKGESSQWRSRHIKWERQRELFFWCTYLVTLMKMNKAIFLIILNFMQLFYSFWSRRTLENQINSLHMALIEAFMTKEN